MANVPPRELDVPMNPWYDKNLSTTYASHWDVPSGPGIRNTLVWLNESFQADGWPRFYFFVSHTYRQDEVVSLPVNWELA